MDTTTIITMLLGTIGTMGVAFAAILRDERQRVKDLLARLDEQQKVVLNAVDVLKDAVGIAKGQGQIYEAVNKLNEACTAINNQKQLYEAIAQLHQATEVIETKRPTRTGGRQNETHG